MVVLLVDAEDFEIYQRHRHRCVFTSLVPLRKQRNRQPLSSMASSQFVTMQPNPMTFRKVVVQN